MKALGFTMSESVHKAILAEAAKLKTSASTLIRKTVCQALGIPDDTVLKRACLIGLTYEQKLERKRAKQAAWKERNIGRYKEYWARNRKRISERQKELKHRRRAKTMNMSVEEYEAVIASGHYVTRPKPVSDATTPEAANFRPVSLNSARHCIDCAHCTTTGKCSRFGLRLNGPHVCDCFQEGG